ncbi:MAG: pyruvate:ferredoxin (flavodoxin) oxidoreductase [Sulfurimonas sp.]|nr:pyruvate:ferredoxin (flavodoxin) oxidoreductase [Sulfurimonas sp.]MBU3939058.1 pyruvate:ferredoxin (flavodoxin) oxidoreductase [bacterium]MBU4024278.1 pyruvate:ferredoxin (flavodoxin) oxidoreductase [bacterium]MBU4059669.1 pyruvate:ferredoxin (flavodoxin) oxidoreductase [bacterium]MBU4110040.1 pyruvate:ferredoxin (flavodoxin) oxidoreductase [bacterium]
MSPKTATIDANEAVARVAHKINEVIAIYPITPASVMGELSDLYSVKGEKNIFGTVPDVTEMQSEGGASAAVHGALQSGALTTTFTASQGLLLMIPNMYKIAGELTPLVIHVAARSLAAQGLSIFGDHQDVMGVRQTGFALFCSCSVQEAHDFSLISQAATLSSRIPFVHFFDGFRTSHEVMKIELLDEAIMKQMIDEELVFAHRSRALTPDKPFIRGTSQNPDVYFQARESVNIFYEKLPALLQEQMDKFAALTGRAYKLFDYIGAEDAEKIIVLMGSGAEAVYESVEYFTKQGEKIGLVKVRLALPFCIEDFIAALPKSTKSIAVLDRTKESGSIGEPLYHDVLTALSEANAEGRLDFALPKIIGGRYGLSSKEFTPAMIKAIFDELGKEKSKNHFTIGIYDDVTHTSLDYDKDFVLEDKDIFEAIFFGLGSDGTVGANKNSIKIIGEETPNYAQGYFVYDSKKSGSVTTSHLRFGPKPIHATYLIQKADFVACHQSVFLEKFEILSHAKEGATFLLNSPFGKDVLWSKLPRDVQKQIIEKKLKFYAIDASSVAQESGMGRRINVIMQTCFFAISGVLEQEEAIKKIKKSILKSYGSKGDALVQMNNKAVDNALENLFEITVPDEVSSEIKMQASIKGDFDAFVENVTRKIIEGHGDELPVSALPNDGTWPSGTTQYEKRNIGLEVPVWDAEVCIQCNKCVLVCPHSVIRSNVVDNSFLADAPEGFSFAQAKGKTFQESEQFMISVAMEDCTGCSLCVEVCPAKNKSQTNLKAINMQAHAPLKEEGIKNWDYFLNLPLIDRTKLDHAKLKESQFLEPLFEFSGACPGCGETPYIKLASQLFGDRMIVANATGCSSIYGGNLPTTPWRKNADGRGPAWSNSLFEDNAEFGLGFRLTIDKHQTQAKELLGELESEVGKELSSEIINAVQHDESDVFAQRERVQNLKEKLKSSSHPQAKNLLSLADYLSKKSVWIIGGDGWAYDIGYGGLDHVLASGKNVNILVLDTQVYSNTGGQQSKATFTGAVAKFAAGGKAQLPKDLGMMAVAYGNVYVARVAMGANDTQTIKAFIEAERYDGPSLIIAYSHCIAHGYDLKYGMNQQKLAVESGIWPTFRYNPDLEKEGKNPMIVDYKEPKISVKEFMYNETRFNMVQMMNSADAKAFIKTAQHHADEQYKRYSNLTNIDYSNKEEEEL